MNNRLCLLMSRNYISFIVLIFLFSGCTDHEYIKSIEDHRKEYLADFLKPRGRSPLSQETIKYVEFFEPNKSFIAKAKVRIIENAPVFKMATYSGKQLDYQKYCAAEFSLNGQELTLFLYKNLRFQNHPEYSKRLFLPFKDETNGETTYGGGRYLDFDISDIENNVLMIDFNKAYNPYCAYSDNWSCPIPPRENHLAVEIKSGEKAFKH